MMRPPECLAVTPRIVSSAISFSSSVKSRGEQIASAYGDTSVQEMDAYRDAYSEFPVPPEKFPVIRLKFPVPLISELARKLMKMLLLF